MCKAIPQRLSRMERRNGFLLLFFILTSAFAAAQPSTFLRMYNKGHTGNAVREAGGNSYVSAGATDFYYNWHWMIMSQIATSGIHFLKTDVNGNLLWERTYNYPLSRSTATWFEPTQDGGFILTGSANRDIAWPPDSNDVVLVKTDANGIVAWSKRYDTGADDLGFCVQPTADGGYIVSGFQDDVPVSLIGNTYVLMIKTDAAGSIQWTKKHQLACRDLNTHEPFPYIIKQTANGGYILVGTTVGLHPADIYVIRTDANGNLVWANSYEHDNSVWRISTGYDVIESSSGNFVIAGSMDKSSPLEINYPFILKISSAGNILDYRAYESFPTQMFQAGFSSVVQTTDGGFFFTGMGGYSDFGMQAQLLKTDANFNMQWSRSYTNDGAATVGAQSGRQTSDGGYVFCGKRLNAGTVVMKTNGVGLIPCKNPTPLSEFPVSLVSVSRMPGVFPPVLSTQPVFLIMQSPMMDTTNICPLFIPPLPIELKYFTASSDGNQVLTEWVTESEINNDYFVVEKSYDNRAFEAAGRVEGSGNSNTERNYYFNDVSSLTARAESGILYYRLKQVDYNGEFSYSKVVPVRWETGAYGMLGLDEKEGTVTLLFREIQAETVRWQLTDLFGRRVAGDTYAAMKGINSISFDRKNITSGIYFITFINGSAKISHKIIL